jgi:E3 ubiquitin-protein ligase HERC3
LSGVSIDVDLGTDAVATSIASAENYSCATLKDGDVKCWGSTTKILGSPTSGTTASVGDEAGEMGEALKAVPKADARTYSTVVAGGLFACATRADKTVYCWGDSSRGATDSDKNLSLGNPSTVAAISLGGHGCAVLTNGGLKCWGANYEGQLGLGDTESRYLPGEMGDQLPLVQLGVGRTARSVASGPQWTCAVLDDGSVKCWGRNAVGELGKGDKVGAGSNAGDMNKLQPLDLGSGRKARHIAIAEDKTTCALLEDGSIVCWGTVNTPTKTFLGDEPAEMGTKLPQVKLAF